MRAPRQRDSLARLATAVLMAEWELPVCAAALLWELYRAPGPVQTEQLRRRCGLGSPNAVAVYATRLRTALPLPAVRAGPLQGYYELTPQCREAVTRALGRVRAALGGVLGQVQ